MAEHSGQAPPVVTQLGGRLACSPPVPLEKDVEIACDSPFQQIIDRPSQFMGQDRQGLALPVFVLEARQIFVAPRIVAEKQASRFGKSPLEIGVADLRAGRAIPLPGGFLGACDQAAIGHEILDPGEAGDVMDLLQQHETQDLANPRDGLEHVQGVGVMLLRRLHNGQL